MIIESWDGSCIFVFLYSVVYNMQYICWHMMCCCISAVFVVYTLSGMEDTKFMEVGLSNINHFSKFSSKLTR